jgi:hypothetical protein
MKQGDKIKQQEIMNYENAEYKILTNLYYSMGTDRMDWGTFEALLVPGLKNKIKNFQTLHQDFNDSEYYNDCIEVATNFMKCHFRNAKLFGPWVGLKQYKEVV